jgi:hypothetical protein
MSENIPTSDEYVKEAIAYFKQMRLENAAHMTSGLSARLEKTNERIESLERSIVSADRSSTRLAASLNRLTLALVIITFLALAWDVFKWSKTPNPEGRSTRRYSTTTPAVTSRACARPAPAGVVADL